MLALSVKTNGSVQIGDNIEVRVLSIVRGIVRLGISAPKDVNIFREELLVDGKCPERFARKQRHK